MVNLKKYQNKTVAVYGMGITGISAAKIFKQLKTKIFCWDDSAIIRKKMNKDNFTIRKFWLKKNLVDFIVISPGIDINKCKIESFLKKNKSKIITDLDIFFGLNKDALIISITGTNGKSTTCKLLEKILKSAKYDVKTVGNIGNPILFSIGSKKNEVFIIEASSYQLQYSKLFRSKHAAILNISPDHLDRHKNLKEYIKVKSKIFFAQKKSDFSYINFSNKHSNVLASIIKSKKIKSKLIKVTKKNSNFLLKKIKNKNFNSNGYIENLSFAYSIAKNLNIKNKIIIKAINNFKTLPHRQEIVFSNKKYLCINDSKATSFDASLQSLSNYKEIYWIVGGIPKKEDYFNLKDVRKKIVKAYIIGENISFFENQLRKYIPYEISKNINNAVSNIYRDILSSSEKKKTILLSPAAASFDQFKNFELRGNYFKNIIVKKFKKKQNV